MLTYLRYALATFCFAASVGCLALWLYGRLTPWCMAGEFCYAPHFAHFQIERGSTLVSYSSLGTALPLPHYAVRHYYRMPDSATFDGAAITQEELELCGQFGRIRNSVFFPLRFPTLFLAFAAVAILGAGKRFTVRSAIIATTMIAVLCGTVVAS